MDSSKLKNIVEAALLASNRPLSVDSLLQLFAEDQEPVERDAIKEVLRELEAECENRGIELKSIASGYRYQTRAELQQWVARLWNEKPPRYSRALLETLALVVYRQPITRAEIEDVRGVSVSSSIFKTLLEREWIKILGHKEVPGRPAMYGTTKQFLDYFNLRSLNELPSLLELTDIDKLNPELNLSEDDAQDQDAESSGEAALPFQVIEGGNPATQH